MTLSFTEIVARDKELYARLDRTILNKRHNAEKPRGRVFNPGTGAMVPPSFHVLDAETRKAVQKWRKTHGQVDDRQ